MDIPKSAYVKRNIIKIIKEINIKEFSVLMDYLKINGTDVEFGIACSHAYFFCTYLKSRKYGRKSKSRNR